MSKVRICDHCGKVVRKYKATRLEHDNYKFSVPWVFHLCEECASELNDWLHSKTKEES